jgi:hypothetical protein
MMRNKARGRVGGFGLAALTSAMLSGCVFSEKCSSCGGGCGMGGGNGNCPRLEKGAIPYPTGTHTRRIEQTQAYLAEADDFVIYEHEWLANNLTTLGAYGSAHLSSILKKFPGVTFPILLEAHADPQLNLARRAAIQQFLVATGAPVEEVERRVVIGFSPAEGLYGPESVVAYTRGFEGYRPFGGLYGTGGGLGAYGSRGYFGLGSLSYGSFGFSGLRGGFGY